MEKVLPIKQGIWVFVLTFLKHIGHIGDIGHIGFFETHRGHNFLIINILYICVKKKVIIIHP
jgi:hypothetical protein